MTITFIYMMFILKIPILMLAWIVRWAWKSQPVEEEPTTEGGGGTMRPLAPSRPRGRGPHGEPSPQPPKRVRTSPERDRTHRS